MNQVTYRFLDHFLYGQIVYYCGKHWSTDPECIMWRVSSSPHTSRGICGTEKKNGSFIIIYPIENIERTIVHTQVGLSENRVPHSSTRSKYFFSQEAVENLAHSNAANSRPEWWLPIPIGSMVLLYMVTFTINIPNVSIYTSTMDPMGYIV